MFQISKRWLWQWGLASIAGLSLQAGSISAVEPAPIYTKNAALRLPVEMDPRTRANVTEIKFYVHGPAGRWDCVLTASANQAAFDFKAPSDGEYKFTFVTVDRRGIATPASVESTAPHRIVIVDTTPPEITVQPTEIRGETLLQCQIRDLNPDLASVRAVYQAADFTWQPLQTAGAKTPTVFRLPSKEILNSKMRVTATDRAGNQTSKDVNLGNLTPSDSPPAIVIDRGRPDPTLLPKEVDPYTAPIAPEVRGAGYKELPKNPKIDQPSFPILPDVPAIKSPDGVPDLKLPESPSIKQPESPDIQIPGEPSMKLPETPSIKFPDSPDIKLPDTQSPIPGPNERMKSPETPMIALPETPMVKPSIDVPPPPAMPMGRATSTLKPNDPSPPEISPIDKKPVEKMGSHELLNTRSISINYQLEGSARFAKKTDFWATADSGRTWKQLTDSSVGISPAKLTLPSDGVFGIRIRPGGGAKQPEPGEEPDCVLEVDATAPAVNLQPPTIGTDEGSMILTWTASDANLLGNSINLYYGSKTDGPWNVIVSGYKNEGVYRWTIPANLSGPIYLRIEAMDRAGNVGRMELPLPVSVETGKQRVKVIGVGPGR